MSDGRFVFLGNVIVDLVMQVDALPEPGGDIIASGSLMTAGGGFNTMTAAARDGASVVFAGQYGSGPFGAIVRHALATSGFTVVQAGISSIDSGYCVALVDSSTERTFITVAGAEGELTVTDLDRVVVGEGDLVFISGYSLAHPHNADVIPAWLERLPVSVTVVTDPGPLIGSLPTDLREIVLARTDILTVNAREARIASNGLEPVEAASALTVKIRAGGAVIVRDGEQGSIVVGSGFELTIVPAMPVTAVDSNGAGDAHGGVLCAALLRGVSLLDAVKRANVAAALAVTRIGPATGPTTEEIELALKMIA